ncbi:MAG: ScyD/ScyE family protein [Chloroflexota bacterium]
MPEITGDIVVTGLNSPQGLLVDSEGLLWVADSGLGGDEEITFVNIHTLQPQTASFGWTSRIIHINADGEQEIVANLPSVAVGEDLVGTARIIELDGIIYATVGGWHESIGEMPTIPHQGELIRLEAGDVVTVADLWAHEFANDPDESTNVESHPYGMAVSPDGMLYIADAAANALWRVDIETGGIETVAAFPGQPGVFPSRFYDNQPITDAVPTAVAFDSDGNIFVSYLTGAPFLPGAAKVVQVGEDGELTDFALGMTMLTDMVMGPDGNLYVVSFGMFTEEGPVFNSGYVARILADGTPEIVIDGLPFATAITFDADGNGYVAINGAPIPEAGMVVYYEALTDMEGSPLPDMSMAN